MVEGVFPKNSIGDVLGFESAKDKLTREKIYEASLAGVSSGLQAADAENPYKKGCSSYGLSCISRVSLFELMHQITMRRTEESVRVEAVSMMNLIVISSHSYKEREK